MRNLNDLQENEIKEVIESGMEMTKVNREFKDSVFRKYFNDEKRLKSLYSALMGIPEDNVESVEFKTLENVICGHTKNDLAALVNNAVIILAEHQTTVNGYMPLRLSDYITEVLHKMLGSGEIYKKTVKKKLPVPKFYVLYNGKEDYPKEKKVKLSDMFVTGYDNDCSIELTVKVININYDKGHELLDKCKYVHDYALFVYMVRKYQEAKYSIDDAVYKAVKECIANGVMVDFLKEYEHEVKNMLTKEITFEEFVEIRVEEAKEYAIEEGRAEGHAKGRAEGNAEGHAEEKIQNAKNFKKAGVALEIIAKCTGLSLETVEAI